MALSKQDKKRTKQASKPIGSTSKIPTAQTHDIPIVQINSNPNQTRTNENTKEYKEGISKLAKDIKKNGLINPITLVRYRGENTSYYLIAGTRRLQAWQLLCDQRITPMHIPANVFILNEDDPELELKKYLITISENESRENVIPIDSITSIIILHTQFKLSIDAVAEEMNLSKSILYTYKDVYDYRLEIQQLLEQNNLSLEKIKTKRNLIKLATFIKNEEPDNANTYIKEYILGQKDSSSIKNDGKKITKNKINDSNNIFESKGYHKVLIKNKKIIIDHKKVAHDNYINVIKSSINTLLCYDDDDDFTDYLSDHSDIIADNIEKIIESMKTNYYEKKNKIKILNQ